MLNNKCVKQIDHLLHEQSARSLHETLMSPYFPWYFNDSIANLNLSCGTAFQFTHTFFDKENGWISASTPLAKMLLEEAFSKLGVYEFSVVRMKANLLTLSGHGPDVSSIHQDRSERGYKSLLYYVNDSDGNTLIIDDAKQNIIQQICPKSNSAVFFDSDIWHSSSPPMSNKRRVVINTIIKV